MIFRKRKKDGPLPDEAFAALRPLRFLPIYDEVSTRSSMTMWVNATDSRNYFPAEDHEDIEGRIREACKKFGIEYEEKQTCLQT